MDIIEAIKKLPQQCNQAWEETQVLDFPTNWKVDNIAVCGMGGSTLSTHILECTAYGLRVPLKIINDYVLPDWAGENTLVLLNSYSGNTEEVLACAEEAKKRGSYIVVLTSGGKLSEFAKENMVPAYIFNPKHNTTKQPRFGIGYSLFGQLGILNKLGIFRDTRFDEYINSSIGMFLPEIDKINQNAKDFSVELKNHLLVILAGQHLVGNAHAFANQMNESAKSFAAWFALPEANHHLLEGLKHPEIAVTGIFLESENYSEKTKKRIKITKEIFEKNSYKILTYTPRNWGILLSEALQVLLFSSLVSAYLGLEYGEDPVSIPTVDYFKEKLG